MSVILSNKGVIRAADQIGIQAASGKVVYEVLRIIEGIPLFLEDHFSRLRDSASITGIKLPFDFNGFRKSASELVKINQQKTGNVKFSCSAAESEIHWTLEFIPHSYPSIQDYQLGVTTDLLFAERINPNAKVVQNGIRENASRMMADQKLYEVLLVDRKCAITEGSRSNVFFVKDGVFYTAPASEVLVGITRQKVIGCLKNMAFPFLEEAVLADEINQFDAAFLTGTSPKVLPIKSIGTREFKTNCKAVSKIMQNYQYEIDRYIQHNR